MVCLNCFQVFGILASERGRKSRVKGGGMGEYQDLKKEIRRLKRKLVSCEKRLEKVRREGKALQSLIRNSALGIVVIDKDHIVQSCNRVFEKLFQYRKSEIVGKNLDEVVAKGEAIAEARGYTDRTLKGKSVRGLGMRFRKDGTSMFVEFFAVPAIVDGEVVGAYGIYQDVSEREELALALKESEERYRKLVDLSPLAIGVFDLEGRILFGNDAAAKVFGIEDVRAFLGKKIFDLLDPTIFDLIRPRFNGFRKGILQPKVEKKIKSIDGRIKHIEVVSSLLSYDGRPAILAVFQDITERIYLRRALQENEMRLKRVLEVSPLGMGLVKNRMMQWHNRAMSRMLGYEPGELRGKEARIIYPNEKEYRRSGKMMASLGKDRRVVEFDSTWVRKNGEVFDCHLWYSLLDEDESGTTVLAIAEDATKRKEMERRLRESEERYRLLVNFSPLPICVFDREYRIFFGNPAAVRLIEAESEEDYVGKSLMDFMAPEFRPIAQKRIASLLQGDRNLPPIIFKALTLKGNEKFVEVYSIPVVFDEKRSVMSIFLDVTEKIKTEERLKREEERYRKLYGEAKRQEGLYRSLLDSSADAIVIYDLKGNVEFISPSFTKIFGWTFDELKGNRIPFVPESEVVSSLQTIHTLLETGQPVHGFETRRLTKDGRILDVSISASCYNDHEGKRRGMLVVLRDVTERKRVEMRVRESEKRFRDLYDSVSDLIYTQDLKGRFLSANRALVDILGVTPEECIGKPTSDFMKEGMKPRFEKEYLEGIKKEGHHEGVGVYFSKDGRKVYLEYRSTLVKTKDGVPYISGIARDVTDRIRADRRIKRLREEMLQAQKMEAIGTLAGGIAHDFNNLLMGIQGNVSLLKMQADPQSEEYKRLKSIEEYIRSGSDLTMQLLGFARGGRYEIKATNLNALIDKEVELFGRTKKEIEIHVKLQEDLWAVEVDQGQMGQVFLNLFVNAWQAMPKGGSIFVQTENLMLEKGLESYPTLKPGRYVKIVVADTGVGMDKKTLERIFEPFFTTKEKGRGTGLGLASVYGIIKNHGGVIGVESEIGQGTSFTIYLPATEKVIFQRKEETRDEVVSGKGKILLVDDEERILDVGKQLLETLGYDVIATKSGEEALRIFKKEKGAFDLVVLDMIMPGMGGAEVFDALRRLDPNIKVLLASGYSLSGQASKIMEKGCNGFIQKPFSMERLSKKIQEVMRGRKEEKTP